MGKLSNLRQGIPPHKNISVGGIDIAVVVVSSDIVRKCEENAEEYVTKNLGKVNDNLKGQYFDQWLAYYSMRDPEDPTLQTRLADNFEEVGSVFDMEELNQVMQAYNQLMMDKAPKLELLTEEEYDDIKKFLNQTQLNDLSTVCAVHLVNFRQAMPSNQ